MKYELALLTFISQDLHEYCENFFKFYTGYHRIKNEDIYVLKENSEKSLDYCLDKYKPVILDQQHKYTPHSNKRMMKYVEIEQVKLLKMYKNVLFVELDEMFLPEPTMYSNILEYIEKRDFPEFVAPNGYEILSDFQPKINWSLPLLNQRIKMARLCGMDKPVLTKIPLHYTFGPHQVSKYSAFSCGSNTRYFRSDLFNIHLKCIDPTLYTNKTFKQDISKYSMETYIKKRCYRTQYKICDIPYSWKKIL